MNQKIDMGGIRTLKISIDYHDNEDPVVIEVNGKEKDVNRLIVRLNHLNNLESNLVHNEYVRVPVEMNTVMRCILRMYSTDPAGIWEELLKASNPETTMEIKNE